MWQHADISYILASIESAEEVWQVYQVISLEATADNLSILHVTRHRQ